MPEQRVEGPAIAERPGVILLRDHERLDRIYSDLLDAFREGDWREVRASWNVFERGLSEHMAREEAELFGGLEAAEPAEIEGLREEHAELRRLLDEMGIGIDLHLVKEDVVHALIGRLREHAKREDVLLYRWADQLS